MKISNVKNEILSYAARQQAIAGKVIAESHIREIWESVGAVVNPVGSMAMGLLCKHRDIDFHIYTETLDVADGFRAITKICKNPAVRRMTYTNLADTDEECIEWHVWYLLDGEEWQIDMIQIRKGSAYDGFFERIAERIRQVLTPETKEVILRLKYQTPESEHIAGIEYYQAVIADGVRTYPEFLEWRKTHPLNGICTWCP